MTEIIDNSKQFVNKFLKRGFLQAIPFWIASIVTGVVAVGYAMMFAKAEELHLYINGIKDWSIFIITPLCFLLAWWIVKKWAPNAKGSGIPQVMAAIELATPKTTSRIDKLLSLRIVIVKIVSSLIMVAGGAAIGREGPTIQIAGSIFYAINRLTPASWPKLSRQSFILTGAAAGLAAAFNTPLGGLVFAMEELAKVHIRFFRTALFSAVIIAGLTAQAIAGPYLYIGYPVVSNLKFIVFFGVALTAILAGFGGALMSRLILYLLSIRSKIKSNLKNILFVTGAGLLMATIAYFINADVMGSGKDIMTKVLFTSSKYEEWHTVVLRIVGPAISFSSGGAGGVFAPALAAGASIGAYLSGLFELAGANANILILGGMVGFLTGLTRSPFTSAILVLEMTDRHSVIFHLLLAAMMAQVAALIIDKRSLYDHLKKQYMQPEEIPAVNHDKKPGST
ncbi:MAG: chloride channel protein [Flavisolibacter sp.]|nr:chloride channel protein [Flavisolibacter sp.]